MTTKLNLGSSQIVKAKLSVEPKTCNVISCFRGTTKKALYLVPIPEEVPTVDIVYNQEESTAECEARLKQTRHVNRSDYHINIIAAAPGSGSAWCRITIELITGKLIRYSQA